MQTSVNNVTYEIIDCQIISLHTDISTQTGERVIILTLDKNLDERFIA